MTDTKQRNEHGVVLSGRWDWEGNALHTFLSELFPGHRGKCDSFHVSRLSKELGLSGEGVYKWLRADRLPPAMVKKLIALSKVSGSRVPELREFDPFVYGD